jgi:4-alpha-glucanotransferase
VLDEGPRGARPGRRESFRLRRSSGVILHPTSLPGGRLGPEAYRFVDWLVEAGQSFWQVLPLGPPDEFGSPYACSSAFAGWEGLLPEAGRRPTARETASFRRRHAYWIDDWLEFTGEPDELATQAAFDLEWSALRTYANGRGVRIVGDLPLYVARDSADVAAHRPFFDLSVDAGAPPDPFSKTGQLWGNPTYRWPVLRRDGYRWWIERFRRSRQLFDLLRLDHFRGYVAYWAIRHGNRTGKNGRWLPGPGKELFDAAAEALGRVRAIAEDLGYITPPVHRLREDLGVPGMHVLQWAFEGDGGTHALANHRDYAVVYTGTHDNDTALGWWRSQPDDVRGRIDEARSQARIPEAEPWWVLVELALSSRSRLAIFQAQDVLGLGSEARTNTPGTFSGNWGWRLEPGRLTRELAARLREATRRWGRLPR